jgi:hypothetical protein
MDKPERFLPLDYGPVAQQQARGGRAAGLSSTAAGLKAPDHLPAEESEPPGISGLISAGGGWALLTV